MVGGDTEHAGGFGGDGAGRTRLEVYSTLEIENLNDFKKTFEAEKPDIEILWNRDSTGVVTARILAEQGQQRGDAIWGWQ